MKYDVFMRTRTLDRDYDWVNKPDYIATSGFAVCRSIIALCENSEFDNLSPDDWFSNFYYLRMEGCCVLARVAKTSYVSSDGHAIISFEGVSVKPENEKRLFHNIPNLVNELFPPAKSFRERLEDDGVMTGEFKFEMLLDPFDGVTVPSEIHDDLKNNEAFKNMMKLTAYAEKPSSFIFGKNAKAFADLVDKSELGIDYVFDFDSPDSVKVSENAFDNMYDPITVDYKAPVATGDDKVAIKLFIQERGENVHRYRWEAKPWDSSVEDSNRARYVSPYYDITDRVELAKLELQKEALYKLLVDKGWKKQQYGLRFERDTFKREGN
jgi:hypothetical protein